MRRVKANKDDLDALAYRFLTKQYLLSRIHSKFGRRATNRAITSMANTLLMCDPDHKRARRWLTDIGEIS